MLKRTRALGVVMTLGLCATSALAEVDANLPKYERVPGISGTLISVGSPTLNNLMTLWAEEFAGFYPDANVQIQGTSTATAAPALIEGTSNFGPMSRPMDDAEQRAFEDRYGYPPALVPVAIDMIAVYVNQDNPIEGLTVQQVDAIFSATRVCGGPSDIRTWGDVGLTGGWANRDIAVYGRTAVSGTYGFFRENALCGGDFKDTVNEHRGVAAVVDGVAQTLGGIGYSRIGYRTSGLRAVPLNGFEATGDNAATGDYPLTRFLYVAANQRPNDGWNPLEREFLRLVLSAEGQGVVNRDGYVTLSAAGAERFRRQFNLD